MTYRDDVHHGKKCNCKQKIVQTSICARINQIGPEKLHQVVRTCSSTVLPLLTIASGLVKHLRMVYSVPVDTVYGSLIPLKRVTSKNALVDSMKEVVHVHIVALFVVSKQIILLKSVKQELWYHLYL